MGFGKASRSFFSLLILWLGIFSQTDSPTPSVILLSHPNTDQTTPQALYEVGIGGSQHTLIDAADGHIFYELAGNWLLLDNGTLGLDLSQPSPVLVPASLPTPEDTPIIPPSFQPLFGPYPIGISLDAYPDPLYAMSGEADTTVNIYALIDGTYCRLTDVLSLFPAAAQPILSASAELVAVRPQASAFLYRAHLRDGTGVDRNGLYLYDLESQTSHEMPYFGKDPVWSPDGMWLAGSRLDDTDSPPLYTLWIANILTGEERSLTYGCNPQWSPDGEWLAFDGHDNAQWQGYTDCFANGQVHGINLETGEQVLFSEGLPDYVTLVGWVEN
jgi:hypothetical protein